MAWNLVRLSQLTGDEAYRHQAEEQLNFLAAKAMQYPLGHGMFLLALLDHEMPPPKTTVVLGEQGTIAELAVKLPTDATVKLLRKPTGEYPLKEGKTTFYVCSGHSCLPPVNDIREFLKS